jgi:hypothetical protein
MAPGRVERMPQRGQRQSVECATGSARRSRTVRRVKGTQGGSFVRTSTSVAELDREGAGCGHAARMGAPVHSTYMAPSYATGGLDNARMQCQ